MRLLPDQLQGGQNIGYVVELPQLGWREGGGRGRGEGGGREG